MSKTTVEFAFEIGERVMVVPLEAPGRVVSLWVSDKGVKYQVRWWINGKLEEEYLFEDDLKAAAG